MSRMIRPSGPYAIVPSSAIRDKELSLSALGMWAVLCNLPPVWEYSVAGFASQRKDGVRAIRSAIRALEKRGYLKRLQIRKDNKFAGYDYVLIENPKQEGGVFKSSARKVSDENSIDENRIQCEQARNTISSDSINNNSISNMCSINELLDEDTLNLLRKENLLP